MTQLPPEGISQSAWDEAVDLLQDWSKGPPTSERIARAIMAATERAEKHWADAMKDPVAVRVNYLRGSIACQPLIDEAVAAERERCARIVEDWRDGHTTFQATDWIAAEIRKPQNDNFKSVPHMGPVA